MRGLVLKLNWDQDHMWAVPSGFQKVRFGVLRVVFLLIAGLVAIVTVAVFAVTREPKFLYGLLIAAVFFGVGLIVRAIANRMLGSLAFAFSRSRGYHNGTVWYEWSQVRRVSVKRDLAHTLHVELTDGNQRAHLLGQIGLGGDTRSVAELLPSYVPADRLDLAKT